MKLLVLLAAVPLLLAAHLENKPIVLADAPAAGACKSVATFVSSAVPSLQKDGCTGCDGGAMPTATTAFDLTKVGKNNAAACASALKKVTLRTNRILQAATGAAAHPGGKVSDKAPFTAALLAWISNE